MDQELVTCFCEEALDLLSKWEAVCIKIDKEIDNKDSLKTYYDELFRAAHNLKGSSRAVGMEEFGNFVHKIEDGITLLKTGEVQTTVEIVALLFKSQAMLHEWIQNAKTNATFSLSYDEFIEKYSALLTTNPNSSNHNVDNKSVDNLNDILKDTNQTTPVIQNTTGSVNKEKLDKNKNVNPISKTKNIDETVRVSASKLEQILEMVGELSIHQAVVWHSRALFEGKNAMLSHSAYLARKLTRELYEKTLSLRMNPIQPVFQRLERNIRELGHSIGKEVEVELQGGEVELDKTVCERIIEPLTHMVRNSIDHGIEKPEDRLAKGKPNKGKIKLSAVLESSGVSLIIEDDGRGLAEDKIIAKAKSQGLINDETKLTKQEIFALIFLPGFSTAEKVTDVSGRGVGMDVVMRTIEELQGSIHIASEPGKGSRFTITLPTSLSIIDALIVRMNGLDYAVPVSSVDEVIDLVDYNISSNDQMFKLRDSILPLQKLSDFLKSDTKDNSSENTSALITKIGKQKVAFKVEKVYEQQQIVVKKLSSSMSSVFGFSGGTILGNGQPGLIIDLPIIAKYYLKKVQPNDKSIQEKSA